MRTSLTPISLRVAVGTVTVVQFPSNTRNRAPLTPVRKYSRELLAPIVDRPFVGLTESPLSQNARERGICLSSDGTFRVRAPGVFRADGVPPICDASRLQTQKSRRRKGGSALFDGVKDCRVRHRDREGVHHGVSLRAVNRYHAFGLATHRLRKCSWCNPDYNDVEHHDGGMVRRVGDAQSDCSADEFEGWLNAPQVRAAEPGREYLAKLQKSDPVRDEVQMLLGRMSASRDFQDGFRSKIT